MPERLFWWVQDTPSYLVQKYRLGRYVGGDEDVIKYLPKLADPQTASDSMLFHLELLFYPTSRPVDHCVSRLLNNRSSCSGRTVTGMDYSSFDKRQQVYNHVPCWPGPRLIST